MRVSVTLLLALSRRHFSTDFNEIYTKDNYHQYLGQVRKSALINYFCWSYAPYTDFMAKYTFLALSLLHFLTDFDETYTKGYYHQYIGQIQKSALIEYFCGSYVP